MTILGIDHVVLTVKSIVESLYFYSSILGMVEMSFENNRKAIQCGEQKINFHEKGKEFEPKAFLPTPGSMDICFVTNRPLEEWLKVFSLHKINLVEGPVEKMGAKGKMLSIYIRDPDLNLVEISKYY